VIDQGGAGMKWKDRGKDGVERWTGSISCEKEQRTAREENLSPRREQHVMFGRAKPTNVRLGKTAQTSAARPVVTRATAS
jgi:hypothetical protein